MTGTVYHDHNQNGLRDTAATVPSSGAGTTSLAIDGGVAGVTVTAYDPSGGAVAATATGADGEYALNPPGSGAMRIEFDPLPAGFEPSVAGAMHDTTVQYVAGDAAGIDLGIHRPCDHCEDDPTLFGVQAYFGDPQGANSDEPAVFDFPYNAGATPNEPDPGPPSSPHDQPTGSTLAVPFGDVGAVWGLAADPDDDRLFATAFMKKHTGFGPAGPGGIYQIDTTTGAVSSFATLTAGADPHDTTDYISDNFNDAWDAVGKVGLGGVDLSDDGEFLYVVNLFDRTVLSLDADTGATLATRQVELALPECPAQADARPFALTTHVDADGVERLYVGIVCSAESTGDSADLAAYVYSLEIGSDGGFPSPWSLRLAARLDYARAASGGTDSTDWEAWTPTFSNNNDGDDGFVMYAQPWLTDIEFDGDDLILGLRDRLGDQTGAGVLSDPDSGGMLRGVAFGDLLRACANASGGFTLESNGACGGVTGAQPDSGFGPGGGEYYNDHSSGLHPETGLGSLAQAPGFPDVVQAQLNPIPESTFQAGYGWYANATGTQSKSYRRYREELGVNFSKANGLGDTELLCERPPVEIGNFVWIDGDRDGVQDPGEAPVGGITVELVEAGAVIATTTTDAEGQYLFTAAHGVRPGGRYTVRIALAQPALSGFEPTVPDANAAIRDSDGIASTEYTQVDVVVGGAGENNHTYDFGFVRAERPSQPQPPPEQGRERQKPKLRIEKVANRDAVEVGEAIEWRVRVRNVGRGTARNVKVCDKLPSELILVRASGKWKADGNRICWRLSKLKPNRSRTFHVVTKVARAKGPRTTGCSGKSRNWVVNKATVRGRRASDCVRVKQPPPPRNGGVTGKRSGDR